MCVCEQFHCDFDFSDLTHGWWSVTSLDYVDRFLRTLCIRGYREKGLYKALQKHKDVISKAMRPRYLHECSKLFKNLLESMKIGESSSSNSSGDKREIEKAVNGDEEVKMDVPSDEGVKEDETDADGLRMDIPSEQEQASLSDKEDVETEKEEQKPSPDRNPEKQPPPEHLPTKGSTVQSTSRPIPESGVYDPQFLEYSLQVEIQALEYLEGIQERLVNATLNKEVGMSNKNTCTCISVG